MYSEGFIYYLYTYATIIIKEKDAVTLRRSKGRTWKGVEGEKTGCVKEQRKGNGILYFTLITV